MSDLASLVEAARDRGLLTYLAASGTNGYSGDAKVVSSPSVIGGEHVASPREALLDVGRILDEESSSDVSVQVRKTREEE